MAGTTKDVLAGLDGVWGDTKSAGGGGMPPDGVYQARIDRFDFEPAPQTGSLQLKTEMVVSGGDHDGSRVRTWHDLQDPDKLKWLKGHLETLGLDLERLSDLADRLPEVLDTPVEIRIKSTSRGEKTYTNVYVNRRLGDPVPKNDLPDAGAAEARVSTEQSTEDDIPF